MYLHRIVINLCFAFSHYAIVMCMHTWVDRSCSSTGLGWNRKANTAYLVDASWMPLGCPLDVTNMHTFPNSQIKQSCTSPQHAHGLRPLPDGAPSGLPHGLFATPTNVVAADGDALVQLQECYLCRLELLIDVRCWDTVLGEADDVFQAARTGYHSLNGQATNRW